MGDADRRDEGRETGACVDEEVECVLPQSTHWYESTVRTGQRMREEETTTAEDAAAAAVRLITFWLRASVVVW